MILEKTRLHKTTVLLLSGALFTVISGCSNEDSEQASASEETVKLVAATITPKNSLLARALTAFGEEIESQSNGEIEVTVHTDGTLGNASSLYQ